MNKKDWILNAIISQMVNDPQHDVAYLEFKGLRRAQEMADYLEEQGLFD